MHFKQRESGILSTSTCNYRLLGSHKQCFNRLREFSFCEKADEDLMHKDVYEYFLLLAWLFLVRILKHSMQSLQICLQKTLQKCSKFCFIVYSFNQFT